VNEAEMTAAVGESANMQKMSTEGDMSLVSASVSEAGTVTPASLLPHSAPSTSTSAETKGMPSIHVSLPAYYLSCETIAAYFGVILLLYVVVL